MQRQQEMFVHNKRLACAGESPKAGRPLGIFPMRALFPAGKRHSCGACVGGRTTATVHIYTTCCSDCNKSPVGGRVRICVFVDVNSEEKGTTSHLQNRSQGAARMAQLDVCGRLFGCIAESIPRDERLRPHSFPSASRVSADFRTASGGDAETPVHRSDRT